MSTLPYMPPPFPASDPRALHRAPHQQSRGPESLGAWAFLPLASPQVPALGGLSGASEEVPSSCLLFSPLDEQADPGQASRQREPRR